MIETLLEDLLFSTTITQYNCPNIISLLSFNPQNIQNEREKAENRWNCPIADSDSSNSGYNKNKLEDLVSKQSLVFLSI